MEKIKPSSQDLSTSEDLLMTIGEAINYMCEQLGGISRTSFYRNGYRNMLRVRNYARNIQTGTKANARCFKSEVDEAIRIIKENPHPGGH